MIYAIGEIALVVIGILLALQINNWNERRKDRIKERNILLEIRSTIQENILTVNTATQSLTESNRSNEIILEFLNDQLEYNDTLSHHFDRSRWPTLTVLEGLSNAGFREAEMIGLDIIQNSNLRKALILYFDKSMPQLISRYSRNSSGFANYDEHTRKILKDLGGPYALPIDKKSIKSDNFYRSIITTLYDNRKGLLRRNHRFEKQSLEIIELLNNELR